MSASASDAAFLEVKKEDLGDDSNKYYDVISKFPVWPVLNFRLTYRIF